MKEIWKNIKGYEGIYQVSNLGNVKSCKRYNSDNRNLKERILKQCGKPYLHVTLSKNNQRRNVAIHVLVAEAFIPNPNNLPCVNHKDENKHNNNVDNLEWCTYGYNNQYSQISQKAAKSRLGKPLSSEHRKKISNTLKMTGKTRSQKRLATMKIKYPNGLKVSDETRYKLSKAQKEYWKRKKLTRLGGNS